MQSFFIVVPPGFEQIGAKELELKSDKIKILSIEKGGLNCSGELKDILVLHYLLKIPTAIYLRIAEFKCRDLPKLFNKVSNIKWGQYLLGDQFSLNVTSSKSRLLHEKKIHKAVAEGIARHFEKQPPKKVMQPFAFEVQVRFFNDICTLSLNLTGEPLFKRGYKQLSAVAPLRENLAAALFFALCLELKSFSMLMDPMCGSGSFLLEAYNFWRIQDHRDFAFQMRKDWAVVEAEIQLEDKSTITEFVACDVEVKNLKNIKESLSSLNLSLEEKNKWQFIEQDIFAPTQSSKQNLLNGAKSAALICNPPYGERLRLPSPPKEYYPKLIQKLLESESVGLGIILPKKYIHFVSKEYAKYKLTKEIEFENGGLPVVFRIYKQI